MTQSENRKFLIDYLLKECGARVQIPSEEGGQRKLLRSLMNVRPPKDISDKFLAVQDDYLQGELAQRAVTDVKDLVPVQQDLYLWQGDITALKCSAIVNAANSQLLGCFCPCHGCIDNAIHTFAGVQLRQECYKIMQRQGYEEPVGRAKITRAYNLPCSYVIHTVGPAISGKLTQKDKKDLAACYTSCLDVAAQNGLGSIAFCCISTGEFRFPPQTAAEIAVSTVKEYKGRTGSGIKIIFNVFKDSDYEIYARLLCADKDN
ncbi:MAG: protein-ADP-ribose hydrolase [Clostridia bacterium]|nr:protein-ADP-ribose hydrolase [Clostridia bacterium]